MAITGINSSGYTAHYAANHTKTVKKEDCERDNTSTKESNVITSTVELKTSTAGVTKTEQIKTGYSNVNDYSKYLQGKYRDNIDAGGSNNGICIKCIFKEVHE